MEDNIKQETSLEKKYRKSKDKKKFMKDFASICSTIDIKHCTPESITTLIDEVLESKTFEFNHKLEMINIILKQLEKCMKDTKSKEFIEAVQKEVKVEGRKK